MGDPNDDHSDGDRDVAASVAPARRRGWPIGSIAVIAVICLQVAIPLIAFLQPPPQKFGFQMYSGLGSVTATVVDAEGNEHSYDVDSLVAKNRPEINWLGRLPGAICAVDSDAEAVRVEQSGVTRSAECD